MKIKQLPSTEHPKERLINFSVNALSNSELLSIILQSGTKQLTAQELALNILKELHTIKKLNEIDYQTLIQINGVNKSKACQILASVELGKRITKKHQTIRELKINSPSDIYEFYYQQLRDKKQEHFYVIYLNTKNKIIKDKLLYVGILNESLLHPRDIFKEAYLINASSIIIIHNHPSGDTTPSKADEIITNQIKIVGTHLGIQLTDHVIISHQEYFSFKENSLL